MRPVTKCIQDKFVAHESRGVMIPQFSLRTLLILVLLSALSIAAMCSQWRPFSPDIRFQAMSFGKSKDFYVRVANVGLRPIWFEGYHSKLTDYKIQCFGGPRLHYGQTLHVATQPPQWIRVDHSVPSRIQVPDGVKEFRVGLVVYDWRGRSAIVWSEKMRRERR